MTLFPTLFEEEEEDEEEVRDADWLYRLPDYQLYAVFEELGITYPDFNTRFWSRPESLYHATTEENAQVIDIEGIKPMNKTRGLANRSVSSAVFTTSNAEDLAMGSYGNVVYHISTGAMKQAGYTPHVSQEPDIEYATVRGALAHRLGIEGYEPDIEHGLWPDTVIIHGAVPVQFLTRT